MLHSKKYDEMLKIEQ